MTDKENRSRVSSSAESKKLSSFTTAQDNDDLNSSIDEKSSNKKTKTETENVVLRFPNSSYLPEASVFSIDHILEFILAQLDRETLLNCRLASRSWMHSSSNVLQNIITIKFSHWYKRRGGSKQQVLLYDGNHDHSIKDLVAVMNNSTHFPCNFFSFHNYISGRIDSLAQRFYIAHGLSLKKLRFAGYLLLTDLKKLLLTHAPNLEQLELNHVEFKYKEFESGAPHKSETKKAERRRESLFSEAVPVGPNPVFKNLKAIILWTSHIPDIFMEQLLKCSPNLVEIHVDHDCFPHYLFKPLNRLHLLKKLVVNIKENRIESLEMAANSPQNNWAVQDIHLLSNNVNWDTDFDLASRATKALTTILKGCSATCENLKWDYWFRDFQIPIMPAVKNFSYHSSGRRGQPWNIFSEGLSLRGTFPNLKTLEIKMSTWEVLENLPIENLFGNNNDHRDLLPLPNVSKVSLECHADRNLLEKFREMFPNAVIQTKE